MINVNCNLPDVSRTRTFPQSVHRYLEHVFAVIKKSKSASLRAVVTVIKDDFSMFIVCS